MTTTSSKPAAPMTSPDLIKEIENLLKLPQPQIQTTKSKKVPPALQEEDPIQTQKLFDDLRQYVYSLPKQLQKPVKTTKDLKIVKK